MRKTTKTDTSWLKLQDIVDIAKMIISISNICCIYECWLREEKMNARKIKIYILVWKSECHFGEVSFSHCKILIQRKIFQFPFSFLEFYSSWGTFFFFLRALSFRLLRYFMLILKTQLFGLDQFYTKDAYISCNFIKIQSVPQLLQFPSGPVEFFSTVLILSSKM